MKNRPIVLKARTSDAPQKESEEVNIKITRPAKKPEPKKTEPIPDKKVASKVALLPKEDTQVETKAVETKAVSTKGPAKETKVAPTPTKSAKETTGATVKKRIFPNKWGRYEDPDTHIVFDGQTKRAYGVQDHKTGKILALSQKHIDICNARTWGYFIIKKEQQPEPKKKPVKSKPVEPESEEEPDATCDMCGYPTEDCICESDDEEHSDSEHSDEEHSKEDDAVEDSDDEEGDVLEDSDDEERSGDEEGENHSDEDEQHGEEHSENNDDEEHSGEGENHSDEDEQHGEEHSDDEEEQLSSKHSVKKAKPAPAKTSRRR